MKAYDSLRWLLDGRELVNTLSVLVNRMLLPNLESEVVRGQIELSCRKPKIAFARLMRIFKQIFSPMGRPEWCSIDALSRCSL